VVPPSSLGLSKTVNRPRSAIVLLRVALIVATISGKFFECFPLPVPKHQD
jgi:hypothetical protein